MQLRAQRFPAGIEHLPVVLVISAANDDRMDIDPGRGTVAIPGLDHLDPETVDPAAAAR